MAKPDGGPNPQDFDDNIGSSGDPDRDRKNVQKLILGTSGQVGLKDQAKQGLAKLKLKEADPKAGQPGWYHPIRIEYIGPKRRSSFASWWRKLFGRSGRRYKKSIKDFKRPTADVRQDVQDLMRSIRTSLQAGMADMSHPEHWLTIIRIAPSKPNDANKIDETSCGCGCHAIGS
jgi:hypothetical protein